MNRTIKFEIDANSGVVFRVTIANGQRELGSQEVARVPVRYNDQGWPYYSYNGQTVWANNKPWHQPVQTQQTQQQVQNQSRPVDNDPGVGIALGILQAIDQAAAQNYRRRR